MKKEEDRFPLVNADDDCAAYVSIWAPHWWTLDTKFSFIFILASSSTILI